MIHITGYEGLGSKSLICARILSLKCFSSFLFALCICQCLILFVPPPFTAADAWILECVSESNGTPLRRDAAFRLRHKQTGLHLFTRVQDRFTPMNCRGCPIVNHLEVSASGLDDKNARFKAGDGYFMPPDDERVVRNYHDFSAPQEVSAEKREKDEL